MVEINNLTTNKVDENFLKKVAKVVLEGERKKESNLSVALIGSQRMRKLNKKYLGKNRVTDVLAFGKNKKFPASETELGELVICLREVKKNVKRFKLPFEKELAQVLIHGILHLLNYNHERSEKEVRLMMEKQKYYLSKISVK